MIRAIVFDCFGVVYQDAFEQLVGRHAQDPAMAAALREVDTALNHGFIPEKQYYQQLAAISGEPVEDIERHMRDTSVLNRDLMPIIKGLQPKYRIAMLSNAQRAFLDGFLAEHNVRPLFDVVLASSQTRFVKPQRELFEILAERLGVSFAELIFIDDSPVNTGAARRYGITSITYEGPAKLQTEFAKLLPPI